MTPTAGRAARSLGRPYRPGPEVVAAVLAVAAAIPDDERRERPGAAFARALPSPAAGADERWDHVLTLLGRDPGWAPTVDG